VIYPFTIASLEKLYNLEYVSSTLDPQEKKKLRLEICASLPKTMLPLHACLLENNGVGIVLSGPGGCGKSTLASALEPLGYRQAAKDFIVVWEEKGKLWGGDLNFQSVNSGKKAVSIEKMVFLNTTPLSFTLNPCILNLKQPQLNTLQEKYSDNYWLTILCWATGYLQKNG